MLDRLANVGILILVALAAVMFWTRPQPPAKRADYYKVGQTISELSVDLTKSTVIIAASSSCQHCNNSLPEFKRLVDAAHRKGVMVLDVINEDEPHHREWLTKAGIVPDQFVAFRTSGLKVAGVPTTFVVNAQKKLLAYVQGELSSASVKPLYAAF